ncbi:hypothetical protein ACO2Q3_22635 [Caulobacter sp. KR2-114]|uniref:hypothetical protein n=1 Tax=Caulobacter sp. KR2-114 TaxID=3400912 RepID=UPI003C0D1DB1
MRDVERRLRRLEAKHEPAAGCLLVLSAEPTEAEWLTIQSASPPVGLVVVTGVTRSGDSSFMASRDA